MKLCLVYNKDNIKCDSVSKNILNFFEDKNKELKSNIITSDVKNKDIKICRKKYDVYVFLTDSIAELKEHSEGLKYPKRSVLITENLSASFISEATNVVNDIIYSRNSMDSICSRLICIYSKYIAEDSLVNVKA